MFWISVIVSIFAFVCMIYNSSQSDIARAEENWSKAIFYLFYAIIWSGIFTINVGGVLALNR